MELTHLSTDMLEMFLQPAFLVKDGSVLQVNQAAAQLQIEAGTDISTLLLTGAEEYAAYRGGSLYLTLLAGGGTGATVMRNNSVDFFLVEEENSQKELRGLSLAAQELRQPLASLMSLADKLMPVHAADGNSTLQTQIAQFNQGLYQMLRLVSNMSFSEKYNNRQSVFTESCNVKQLFEELFASTEELVAKADRALHFTGLDKTVICLINKELLERATLNLISNAIKFSPKGSSINACLFCKNRTLYLTVENRKSESSSSSAQELFSAFLRSPGIRDGRQGIGLGMVLVRSAASAHGGTVLVEQTADSIKVTLTVKLRQSTGTELRSNLLSVDYAGERDHKLIELADALPSSAFDQLN